MSQRSPKTAYVNTIPDIPTVGHVTTNEQMEATTKDSIQRKFRMA